MSCPCCVARPNQFRTDRLAFHAVVTVGDLIRHDRIIQAWRALDDAIQADYADAALERPCEMNAMDFVEPLP